MSEREPIEMPHPDVIPDWMWKEIIAERDREEQPPEVPPQKETENE